jgi:hypothetical protein
LESLYWVVGGGCSFGFWVVVVACWLMGVGRCSRVCSMYDLQVQWEAVWNRKKGDPAKPTHPLYDDQTDLLTSELVGWLAGWLVGSRLVIWLAGGWLVNWLVGQEAPASSDCLSCPTYATNPPSASPVSPTSSRHKQRCLLEWCTSCISCICIVS